MRDNDDLVQDKKINMMHIMWPSKACRLIEENVKSLYKM